MNRLERLRCIRCRTEFAADDIRYECTCGDLLEVVWPEGHFASLRPSTFDRRRGARAPLDASGVWRFREAVMGADPARTICHPEGATPLYQRAQLSAYANVDQLWFKHEGENPTGSFKDRGMTVATTQAVHVGAKAVACASTGNTSASMAAYAGHAGLGAFVFIPHGKVSSGKLAQTLGYGATCLMVRGDFDAAMKLVNDVSTKLPVYLLNSKNPFRIEGQKTIVWELLQDLDWEAPDWIALPAGNLGNTAAFGKALREAYEGGWIRSIPKLLSVQAQGANPFYQSYRDAFKTRHRVQAETIASAIRIGDPVSYDKARAAIEQTRGLVCEVSDEELMTAKRTIDRAGIGCEPASACSLAGVKKLRTSNIIATGERVVCVLTGHMLKDPDNTMPPVGEARIVEVEPSLGEVVRVIEKLLAP